MAGPGDHLKKILMLAAVTFVAVIGTVRPAHGQTLQPQERLCDPSFEDCRADLLKYIESGNRRDRRRLLAHGRRPLQERIIAAFNSGVRVRILMDPRCTTEHAQCQPINDKLKAAGIPMRNRVHGRHPALEDDAVRRQQQLEFAGANFAPFEFVPATPYVNYTDEVDLLHERRRRWFRAS